MAWNDVNRQSNNDVRSEELRYQMHQHDARVHGVPFIGTEHQAREARRREQERQTQLYRGWRWFAIALVIVWAIWRFAPSW